MSKYLFSALVACIVIASSNTNADAGWFRRHRHKDVNHTVLKERTKTATFGGCANGTCPK